MRSVNANAPVAVINSNCSSFRSCAHTVVRVTESDQCYYWRPDGLQGFFVDGGDFIFIAGVFFI